MKILALGDVVGNCGVRSVTSHLRELKQRTGADVVIVNGENSAEPNGMTVKSARALLEAGADVVTGGNHSLRFTEIFDFMDAHPNILRPLNITDSPVGNGYVITRVFAGRLMTVSLVGQTFMSAADSPFSAMERLLERERGNYDMVVVDLHAEATSEKLAFVNRFADRVSAVFGTHTHVQTADEQILRGCAYISDLGMCGARESILGAKTDIIVRRFVTRLNEKFAVADGPAAVCGVVAEFDGHGRAVSVERVRVDE